MAPAATAAHGINFTLNKQCKVVIPGKRCAHRWA